MNLDTMTVAEIQSLLAYKKIGSGKHYEFVLHISSTSAAWGKHYIKSSKNGSHKFIYDRRSYPSKWRQITKQDVEAFFDRILNIKQRKIEYWTRQAELAKRELDALNAT